MEPAEDHLCADWYRPGVFRVCEGVYRVPLPLPTVASFSIHHRDTLEWMRVASTGEMAESRSGSWPRSADAAAPSRDIPQCAIAARTGSMR